MHFGLHRLTLQPLDTLLDLHAKLSTVVRYYDRMLEERLSSAYSQHSLGFGTVPGAAAQYPNMYPSMPSQPVEGKAGAENFYYGNPVAEKPRPSDPYAQYPPERANHEGATPRSGAMSPGMYPPPLQPLTHNHPWSGNAPVASPPPPSSNPPFPSNPAAYPGAGAPAQFFAPPTQREPAPNPYQVPRPGDADASYQPSPITRTNSLYQQAGPPAAPAPSAPEQPPSMDQIPSAAYMQLAESQAGQPNGHHGAQHAPQEQQTQSYYYPQQQPPGPPPSMYPQSTPAPQAAYPVGDVSPITGHPSPIQYHQPPQARPAAEESLIEL